MLKDHNLTPEQKLLIHCLRFEWNPGAITGSLLKAGLYWSELRDLAVGHGVLPLVFQRLKAIPPGLIPEGEWGAFKDLFIANGRRNLRLAQRLIQLLDLLNNRGIRVLPLKGPVLALQAYGDLSARQITDIDFLIRDHQVEPAYAVLGEAGYRTASPLTPRMIRHLARTGKDFWLRGPGIQLDFHQHIPEGPPSFRFNDSLWDDLEAIELLDHQVPVLSSENTLFLLVLHGTESGWNSLSLIADLGHFIRTNPQLNWRAVTERAGEMGCRRILSLGLTLAGEVLGVNLPLGLMEPMNRDLKTQALAGKILDGLFRQNSEMQELTIFQRSFDSISDRLKYIGYYALAPRTGDWMALPLPDPLFPFYYLYRPLHLLAKFGPTLLRSLIQR